MNQLLIWLLLVPVIVGVAIWVVNRENRDMQAVLVGVGAFVVVSFLVTLSLFFIAKGSATDDVEIWSGQVTGKTKDLGSYEQPYDCFCSTDSKGNRSCRTCYETHYTVKWDCQTTVGNFRINDVDSTNKNRAYSTPDTPRWLQIAVGDPASKRHNYTNYIQAVPNSLFTPSSADLKAKFASLIPAYPDKVYDFYKIDRVLTPGYSMPDIAQWNQNLSLMLRELGPTKQANAILVIAKTDDPNYEYAIRDAWEGANKNDVVVLVGSKNFPTIDFVRVISWTKSEIFKVELRDRLMDAGVVNRQMIDVIGEQIGKNFVRRKMAEFEYLSNEIDPPTWLVILDILLVLAGGVGAHMLINNNNYSRRRF